MAKKSRTLAAELLREADLAISKAINDPEILSALAPFGYDRTRLASGRALLDAAKTAISARILVEGAQVEATTNLKTTEIAAREAFQALAQVAKTAFGRETLASLGLSSAMPHAHPAFLNAGYALFENAQKLPDVLSKLSKYGYDAPKLNIERDKISSFARAMYAHEAAKGAAYQATDTQKGVGRSS